MESTATTGVRVRSGVRWTVCALIFFATTVNYLDRQIFSLLVPFFENDLRLGPTDLALINVSFILPYGLAMVFVGRWLDRVGIKRGLSATYLLWSLALAAHAFVRSLGGFVGVRFVMGLGESGMYPAGVKTVTDWFPKKERAFATGIFNAGANCGAMLAPLIGVFIATKYGWRVSFLTVGVIGTLWLLFWRRLYRDPDSNPNVTTDELAYIRSEPEEEGPRLSFGQLFGLRPLYPLGVAKALTDAPWWFYLTWMPKFLVDQFHLSTTFMAFAIPVIYVVADLGSVGGGWLSSNLIHRGKPVGSARKLTMLVCALLVVPVMAVGFLVDHGPIAGVPAVIWAVGIVALAAGAHQGWSSNLFTLISDTVPQNSVAMAVGAINGFAMVGVSAMQFFVGRAVELTSSYTLPFVVAGSLYLVALAILQLMLPQVRRYSAARSVRIPWIVLGAAVVLAGLAFLQWETNRPPYSSMADYLTLRRTELKSPAEALKGPPAQVGWMDAQWIGWRKSSGDTKLELVKFDTQGRPYVEPKGSKAAKYKGPSEDQVRRAVGSGIPSL